MIPQQFIEEIQARTDIAELISSYIPLKKAGRNFKALCPFHNEKTPSFLISPQKQIFHCFGCGEGGGVIQFLMLFEKVSFVEAVEILAKRLGQEIPYQKTSPQQRIKTTLYEVVHQASCFFSANLAQDLKAEEARKYLVSRKLNKEIVKQFCIGYAPGRNMLLEFMRKKGVSLDLLEKSSLVTPKREGGYMDLFRERIMLPIFDIRSRIVGFGARTLREKENIPKYINSLESPIYSKREHLYGFNFSKEEVLKKDSVIVVEGYFDMIIPYLNGVRNIAASLGTALTIEQIRLIKRYTKNVILVFDSDKAGQMAALRALDLLLENELKIDIVSMPEGLDPDSLVREKGKDCFLELIQDKVDFFDYKIGILKGMYDFDSIEGKSKTAKEMLFTINKIGSEVEKYEYTKKLSSSLGVREEVLLLESRKLKKPGIKNKKSSGSDFLKEPVPITEKMIIQFILNSKKAAALIKNNLSKECFSHPLARKTISLLFNDFIENRNWSLPQLLGDIKDKEVARFISELLIEEKLLDKDLLKNCIVKLRSKRLKASKDGLRRELKEAEVKKDKDKSNKLMLRCKEIDSEVKT
ncbi:MAG: DNA primase [Candidatus Omnitrophica bacterium]|nr:DNA primase [Candidatus Omnitrophota bacterium]